MPKYNFLCQDCNHNQQDQLSIEQYRSIKDINYICIICGSKNLSRVFKNTHSNIDRNTQELLEEIREETKVTLDKINSGDISSISDIYGQEINKLKVKS
jgi:hypothetical protein